MGGESKRCALRYSNNLRNKTFAAPRRTLLGLVAMLVLWAWHGEGKWESGEVERLTRDIRVAATGQRSPVVHNAPYFYLHTRVLAFEL